MKKPVERLVPTMMGQLHQTYWQVHRDHEDMIVHHAMTQISLRAGLKTFGKKGEDAVTKELKQLNVRNTFKPMDPNKLIQEQQQEALESYNFFTKRKEKAIKAHVSASEISSAVRFQKIQPHCSQWLSNLY